jgi:large subunit ribosomal protein L15e
MKKAIKEAKKRKLIEWRKSNAIVKINKPSDIGRARTLGYKAKKGVIVARVRIKRGGRKRQQPKGGRRTKRQTIRKTLKMNYRGIAEQRAGKKFKNLEVLNSYNTGQDGVNYFFEVILIDLTKPEIKSDKTLNWICKKKHKRRTFRGLTSAGKKSRGLRKKSREAKVRPSLRKHRRRGK